MADLAQMESGEFPSEDIGEFSAEADDWIAAEFSDVEEMAEDYEDDGDYLYGAEADFDEYPEEFDPDLEYKAFVEDAE